MSFSGSLLSKLIASIVLFLIVSWLIIHHSGNGAGGDGGVNSKVFRSVNEQIKIDSKSVLNAPEVPALVPKKPKFTVVKTSKDLENENEATNDDANSVSVLADSEKIFNLKSNRSILHTVTYASHGGRDDRFCRAVESAIRHNFDLVILGWKVPWKGLSQKLEAAHSFAASLPPNDLILFTDAFDVMFTDSPAHIQSKFEQGHYDLLFSAECGCWPHIMEADKEACFKHYPVSPTPYRYLNSGTWIGKANLAALMLAEVMKEAGQNFGNANDQKLVADMYIAGRHGIKLDFYNSIFQSQHMTLDPPLPRCNPMEDTVLTADKRFHNTRTDSYPAVIHFNGGGKAHHLKMESQIWYKAEQYNTPQARKELGAHLLSVPSQPGGKLRFDELCKGYI